MGMPAFLSQIFEHGRVRAARPEPISEAELSQVRRELAELEQAWRQTVPGTAPEFLIDAALWAAETIYRSSQCLVYPELSVQIARLITAPAPRGPHTAAQHYSVDLALRFLPDIWRLARSRAEEGPLVSQALDLAAEWPLSSVGISGISARSIDAIAADECLLALYVDRVLERKDRSRLDDPRVRNKVQAAIGPFDDLAAWLT